MFVAAGAVEVEGVRPVAVAEAVAAEAELVPEREPAPAAVLERALVGAVARPGTSLRLKCFLPGLPTLRPAQPAESTEIASVFPLAL